MFRTCFLGGLVLLLSTQLCAQFQPQVTYTTGANPFSVAVGDFNEDGHPDLAVTNNAASPSNGLSVLLGNGDGTFRPHVDYATGNRPSSVVVGDFNGDGKLDLAVTSGPDNAVNVLLGNGDGTFQAQVPYATGINPQWLVAADFNGDGRLDLATANYGPDYSNGTVSVFSGNGDGTFQSQVQYTAGVNPFGIMAADLNRDGKVDLVVVNNNGGFGVRVLFGNGDGSFQSPVYYPSGSNPRVGVVADLNSDGYLDLAVANCISNSVSTYQGDGNGNFSPPVTYAAGICPQTLAGGDFDGDGNFDLVTANSGNNNVTVLKGSGTGTFPTTASFAVGTNPMWVTVADLNGDTAPDLVVTNNADNTVSVLLNVGTDFSISASPASPATVKRGQTSTSTVSLALLTSYNSPVTLACSVQPAQSAPACSFNPNPVTFTNGNGTATLTLDTGITTGRRGNLVQFLWFPVVGFALVAACFRSRRKKPAALMLSVILIGGLIFQAACAGTNTVHQPPQTYTITVTGTAGSHQHSTTTTLTVQ
jgi:hypothetical protein